MSIPISLVDELLQVRPHLRSQHYFKSSLIALSHAMEDQVLVGSDRPLVIASFQCERFYQQETHRYLQLAQRTDQLYVLTSLLTNAQTGSVPYEIIPFEPSDQLSKEWHLVVLGQQYASCLFCREEKVLRTHSPDADSQPESLDQARRFEGLWTLDRQTSSEAARLLIRRMLVYRPELAAKFRQVVTQLTTAGSSELPQLDPTPLTERLVTYLQTSQYKLMKAYHQIAEQERKEHLVNTINVAIRRSLNPNEILQVAVQQLGQMFPSCRCLIYPCQATNPTAIIQHEFLGTDVMSLVGQAWPLQSNPLFQAVVQNQESIYIEDTTTDARIATAQPLQALVERDSIRSWLLVPVLYQGRMLGMVELHYCGGEDASISGDDTLSLVELTASLVGVALQG